MFDDFFIRALVAGIGIALVTGPLGCFVVWRRLSYFGDTLSHSALLGVTIAYTFDLNIALSVFLISSVIALILIQLQKRTNLPGDALLGLLAHSSLAVGLVVVSFLTGVRIDLMAYLFGDILAVSEFDLGVIWTGALVVLALILWRWKPLFLSTFNEELSYASGFNPKREQLFLTIGLGITVAVSIKVVGVLLITAMLIIPAAAARNLARDPEMMVFAAALVSCISVTVGLRGSYIFDTPPGPTIVCVTLFIFIVLNLVNSVRKLTL